MMTSKVIEKFTKNTFPKLMKSNKTDGLIVLFSGENYGVAVATKSYYYLGYYNEDWDMSVFEDFHGSVTITQE